MEETHRYYDLCIPYRENEKEMEAIVTELIELGYKTIAIDQPYDYLKTKPREKVVFPLPKDIKYLIDKFGKRIKILQRLTIFYSDASVHQPMTASLNLKKFNIVAGAPKTDAALNHCCTTFIGDLITFTADCGARLLLTRKSYNVAMQRKMFFEIRYGPLLVNKTLRKDIIKMTANLATLGRAKNIVISSAAENPFQIRGPHDVAFMSHIFGLSEAEGINCIDIWARHLICKGESRRIGKTLMVVKGNGPIVLPDFLVDDSEKKSIDKNPSEAKDNQKNHPKIKKINDNKSKDHMTKENKNRKGVVAKMDNKVPLKIYAKCDEDKNKLSEFLVPQSPAPKRKKIK